MMPAEIVPWLTLILSSVAVLGHLKGWMNSGEKKLLDDVGVLKADSESHEKKLTEHDRRIQSVEGELKHLPDKDTVHRLQVDMTEMKVQMVTIVKASEATERATRRVEEFLMSRKD